MAYRFDPQNPFESGKSNNKKRKNMDDQQGLGIEHFFSTEGVHPFEQLEWETRAAKITGDDGQAIFEQDNIEVPASWSQLATKVVSSKYFYGDMETGQREHSAKQLIHRVCRSLADRGLKDGYFTSQAQADIYYAELCWLCINQYA